MTPSAKFSKPAASEEDNHASPEDADSDAASDASAADGDANDDTNGGAPEAEIALVPADPERRSRFLLGVVLLAGVVLFMPALRAPFIIDDYLHAAMIDGTFPAKRGPFDLYNFVNDADRALLTERGMLPWWSHPALTIRFFRPLSSALLWADHKLLGNAPFPLHLHSLVWWAASVLAARALFKRAFSTRVATMATAIFALAPCHALPLAWLANREALVSLVFGTLGLGAYVRWRERLFDSRAGASRDAVIAAGFFALAMLGGEYGLSLGGYVLAYEIFARSEPLGKRLAGLAPFAVPAGAYLAVRAAYHFGAAGSGFYSDPIREPGAFLRTAPARLVTLLAEAWFSLDVDTLTATTPGWVLAIIGAVGLLLFSIPVRRALGSLEDRERRTASFLLLGSALSLAPVLAVVPSPRLLGAGMLGTAPVIALIFEHAWFPKIPWERRGLPELTGLVALLLGFLHFVHGPATSWLIGRHFQRTATDFARYAREARSRVESPETAEVVVMRGMGGSFFLPFALNDRGEPPWRWRILAQTGHVLALRKGPRTLDVLVPKGHSVFPTGHGNLFRHEKAKLSVGDVFDVPGLHATILTVGEEGPESVRFDFDRDLESAPLVWIHEGFKGFFDASPPKQGFGKPFDP